MQLVLQTFRVICNVYNTMQNFMSFLVLLTNWLFWVSRIYTQVSEKGNIYINNKKNAKVKHAKNGQCSKKIFWLRRRDNFKKLKKFVKLKLLYCILLFCWITNEFNKIPFSTYTFHYTYKSSEIYSFILHAGSGCKIVRCEV